MKRLLKILRNIFFTLIAIITLLLALINVASVQTFLAQKATAIFSKKLNTTVNIDNVRIQLLNYVVIEGLYVEDLKKDTLAYIGKAQLRITDLLFLGNKTPVIHYIGLNDAFINLNRAKNSQEWNYSFIEKAFGSSSPKKSSSKSQSIEFDIEKILFHHIKFRMDDAWTGYDYDIDLGDFTLNVDDINFKKKEIAISSLVLEASSIRLHDYLGGKAPEAKKPVTIDTTAFNPDKWSIKATLIEFEDCHFSFISKETAAYPKEFDPEHIDVSALNAKIKNLTLVGDTLKAQMAHFSAKERSGFIIKEMQSDISISPNASICKELFLETNNSKLSNYYAMHYERFPDFTDFISKVKMDVRLQRSNVDMRDIAYFAPDLRELPFTTVKIAGTAKGTVDKLVTRNLDLTDGFSTVKGDLIIVGLPDIDASVFDLQNGKIFTAGSSIIRYVPQLKDNPNINLKALDFAYFEGSFTGKLNDFAAKGSINSNLGSVLADIKMKLPKNSPATYSGTVRSNAFNAGLLFNQASLGTTTFNAQIEGSNFDLAGVNIKANVKVQDITFNGYTYRDIIADGTFNNRTFDGQLLINDSNISMGFYGNIDLSKEEITINATANLLKSDLEALKFTNVPTTLVADFDLNCSGKTIDDFIGSAKLYNINLTRKAKRLDLDSINIKSYIENNEQQIDIESNLLSAKVNGRFLLSEIPNSTQYYLGKYLPNFINGSKKVAANQDVKFNIKTRSVNDLIMAFSDVVSGFDNASFSGNLNTINQTLSLNCAIPFSKIADVKLYQTKIVGKGNYSKLDISTTVEKFILGKNILNTSLALDASVGNDSLQYTIATKSDEQYGTATLRGNVVASNDSLFMNLMPSELFLNNVKWEIPTGNNIVYATNYLSVLDLKLISGLQSITFNTDAKKDGMPLIIQSNNIDIGQLASLSNLASYQPEGRINGSIGIAHIFTQQKITTDIEASGLKLGADTIGMLKLIGSYDAAQKAINIEKSSGIFNDKFSMNAYGNISLDPNNKDQLDGALNISNFPMSLLAPLLKGYATKLGGTLDGSVALKGKMNKPSLEGSINLNNVAARVDFTGAFYTIPNGKILLKQQTLELDDIQLYDVYKNVATASGNLKFNNISQPQINLRLSTDDFEVVNLRSYENELFYGHVFAKTEFSISGNTNDIRMNINATPTRKSNLFLPYNDAGDISANTYITFKSYEQTTANKPSKVKDKLSVKISAVLNNLIEVSLVLDPNTGDQINATGNGNLSINVPANDDYSMFGTYNIDKGSYTFTFRQVLSKTFNINSGSSINFGGNISNTRLNVSATYPTRARLYDLLDQNEAAQIKDNQKELDDSKASQIVNVQLQMNGTLANPDLSYEIELPEKRSLGTAAYAKLNRINSSDKTALTNQVSSLLFLGSFMPSQGITSTLAVTGAKNTLGETIASQASPLLTTALNKLLGDPKLQVLVQYKSYGQDESSSSSSATDSRNEVKFGIKKNYFNDRLILQVGSAYDWGRPTSSNQSTNNFNLAGDFRAQYLLRPDGGVSLVGFRASNYDLFYGYNIARTGIGITFRKKFDNLYEFFHNQKKNKDEKPKGAKQ